MNVVINGAPRELAPTSTIADLLRELDLEGKPTAVEVNREVIQKKELETRTLEDGDRVEIVTFVGGG